jgi:hypothetical protein
MSHITLSTLHTILLTSKANDNNAIEGDKNITVDKETLLTQ